MKFINWLTERLVNFEEGVPSMFESKWLYEIMLVIYSLSLMGYFFDFIKKNWKVNRISFSLLCIVWAMQTAILYNQTRSEEHTSELQSRGHLVCRLLLEKK